MNNLDAFDRHIHRVCCPGKNDGSVELTFDVTAVIREGQPVVLYGYRRDNRDWYFGPTDSLTELAKLLNDPSYFSKEESRRYRVWYGDTPPEVIDVEADDEAGAIKAAAAIVGPITAGLDIVEKL